MRTLLAMLALALPALAGPSVGDDERSWRAWGATAPAGIPWNEESRKWESRR